MNVTLKLKAETEQLLKDKAARAGLSLEEYLQALAERDAIPAEGSRDISAPLTPSQWSLEWRTWANSERKLPTGLVIDESRESIYSGRGE